MKKIALILSALLMATTVWAQEIDKKEELKGEASPEFRAMRLAGNLVRYGYEQQSAFTLMDAMQILIDNPTQPLKVDMEGSQDINKGDAKSGVMTFDFDKLLADARTFADGDATTLKLIDRIEADSKGVHRGAVNGPSVGDYVLPGYSNHTFNISFIANRIAEVAVSGDGDTDLDLFVYDSNGNLIASDTDYTDDCYVRWVPKWTGRFRIVVVNRGAVYNHYAIGTN